MKKGGILMAKKKATSHKSAAEREQVAQRRAALESEIKSMATKANARLRALEKADLTAASNAYRYVERRHFDKDTAISEDRSGRIKFDTALKKKTANQLQHEKRELERFLYEAKTSTVKGTNARYDAAYETYTKNHPSITLSKKEFQSIMRTAGFRTYVKAYGSGQIQNLMEKIQDARNRDPMYMADLEKALGELSLDTARDDFYKNAFPPEVWMKNEAEEEDEDLPDVSAWGAEEEEDHEWLSLDEFLALPKKSSGRKSSGGKRRKR